MKGITQYLNENMAGEFRRFVYMFMKFNDSKDNIDEIKKRWDGILDDMGVEGYHVNFIHASDVRGTGKYKYDYCLNITDFISMGNSRTRSIEGPVAFMRDEKQNEKDIWVAILEKDDAHDFYAVIKFSPKDHTGMIDSYPVIDWHIKAISDGEIKRALEETMKCFKGPKFDNMSV